MTLIDVLVSAPKMNIHTPAPHTPVCAMLRTGLDNVQGLGPEACGKAWKVVEASRTAVTRLEAMIAMTSSDTYTHASQQKQRLQLLPPPPSSTMRASLADALGEIAKEEEIMSLRKELQECREDLLRDEDIFATKVRELKSYRKQIRQLQQENTDLLHRQQQLQEPQHHHRIQSSTLEEKHGSTGDGYSSSNGLSSPSAAAAAATGGRADTTVDGGTAAGAAAGGGAGAGATMAVADKKGFWDKKIAEAASKQSSPAKAAFDAGMYREHPSYFSFFSSSSSSSASSSSSSSSSSSFSSSTSSSPSSSSITPSHPPLPQP